MSAAPERARCAWAQAADMHAYHDDEWGVPVHDDRVLFEFITLEGAQAGLSWRTVLAKRAHYRRAFHDWDIARIAALDDAALERLLAPDSGLVRSRLKIYSVRRNAQAASRLIAAHGSLDAYLWEVVGGAARVNHWPAGGVPATSAESDRLSRELKKAGMSFVGSTILYAFMQAVGMVDDHAEVCWRRAAPGHA
jgi:DNA-3-methyladenine glycosylase I